MYADAFGLNGKIKVLITSGLGSGSPKYLDLTINMN